MSREESRCSNRNRSARTRAPVTVLSPDSLNTLFEPPNARGLRLIGEVTFEYADCEVSVQAPDDVEVRSIGEQPGPQPKPNGG
ncbi:HalOD1 output domain-containing protein [Natronosalvus hydrolyticus]|uniref:HalOD1 output domain-containing protein n=1 Tax=Natronosalvus hydrolyticus TaxID=2979988 RepID=UPI003CCC6FE4